MFTNAVSVGEIVCMINAKVSNWIKSQVKTSESVSKCNFCVFQSEIPRLSSNILQIDSIVHFMTEIDAVFKELDDMLFVHVKVKVIREMKVNKSKTLRGVKADIKQDMDEYLWPIVRFFMSNLPFVAALISLPWIICR